MTISQALGRTVDQRKAQAKVQEVEREARFSQVRALITSIVDNTPRLSGVTDEQIRDNAIVFAMNLNLDFRFAVSQKLNQAFNNGEL